MKRRIAVVVAIGILGAGAASIMCRRSAQSPSVDPPAADQSAPAGGTSLPATHPPSGRVAGAGVPVAQDAVLPPSPSLGPVPSEDSLPACCIALAKLERASDLPVQQALQVCFYHAKRSSPQTDLHAAVRDVLGVRTPKGCQ